MNSLRLWFGFVAVAVVILVGQLRATFILEDLSLHAGGGVAWVHGLRRSSGGFINVEDRGDHQTAAAAIGADYRLLPNLSLTASHVRLATIENELGYPPNVVFIAPPPDRIQYRTQAVLAGVEVRPFTHGRFALELGAGAASIRHSTEERGGFYFNSERKQSDTELYGKIGATAGLTESWAAEAEWLSFPVNDLRFEGDDASIGAVTLSLSYHFR